MLPVRWRLWGPYEDAIFLALVAYSINRNILEYLAQDDTLLWDLEIDEEETARRYYKTY